MCQKAEVKTCYINASRECDTAPENVDGLPDLE